METAQLYTVTDSAGVDRLLEIMTPGYWITQSDAATIVVKINEKKRATSLSAVTANMTPLEVPQDSDIPLKKVFEKIKQGFEHKTLTHFCILSIPEAMPADHAASIIDDARKQAEQAEQDRKKAEADALAAKLEAEQKAKDAEAAKSSDGLVVLGLIAAVGAWYFLRRKGN